VLGGTELFVNLTNSLFGSGSFFDIVIDGRDAWAAAAPLNALIS